MPPYAEHWHFPQYRRRVIPYMIASNCEEVRLFLNGKQFYVPRPDTCPDRLITGYLPWQPGTVEVVGYRNGKKSAVIRLQRRGWRSDCCLNSRL